MSTRENIESAAAETVWQLGSGRTAAEGAHGANAHPYSIKEEPLAAGDKSKSGKEKERWREDGLKRGYGRDGTH